MKKILFSGFLFLIFSIIAAANDLTISYGDYSSEPYALVKDGKLTGGIIKEIGDAVGTDLGVKINYKNIPRKRIYAELESGETSIVSITNPDWVDDKTKYNWSIPLFEESDIFVMLASKKFNIKDFKDLKGKRMGTILGYYYPGLMEMFEKKEIIRDDVSLLENNFKKLEADRIDLLIDSNILINHYIRKNNLTEKVVISEKIASTHMIYFAISKKSPISAEKINGSLKKIKDSGKIDEILKKYK